MNPSRKISRNSSVSGSLLAGSDVSREGAAERGASTGLSSLLGDIARQDSQALSRLYDLTSRWIYGLAVKILGDPERAEEVTLDVYLQVWRSAGSFEPARGTPGAWLLTMARSRALDCLRSSALRRSREKALSEDFDAAWEGPRPEAANLMEERRRHVIEALSSLPEEQKKAIELGFFQGLSHTEIAERLREPVGTVKTRIRLGMLKLRNLLKPFEDFE